MKLISYARQSAIWGVNKEQNSYAFISHVAFSLRQTNTNQVITQVNVLFRIEINVTKENYNY